MNLYVAPKAGIDTIRGELLDQIQERYPQLKYLCFHRAKHDDRYAVYSVERIRNGHK